MLLLSVWQSVLSCNRALVCIWLLIPLRLLLRLHRLFPRLSLTFSRLTRWKLWLKPTCCKSSFSLFVGTGITVVGEKANALKHTIDGLAEVSYKIVGMIMAVAPIGVFGLITPVVASNGPAVLLPLLKVVIAVYLACLLHAVLVYGSMIKFIAGMGFINSLRVLLRRP